MSTSRFAILAIKAITNRNIYESWISIKPGIFLLYINQYLPILAYLMSMKLGFKRVEAHINNEDVQSAIKLNFKALKDLFVQQKSKKKVMNKINVAKNTYKINYLIINRALSKLLLKFLSIISMRG